MKKKTLTTTRNIPAARNREKDLRIGRARPSKREILERIKPKMPFEDYLKLLDRSYPVRLAAFSALRDASPKPRTYEEALDMICEGEIQYQLARSMVTEFYTKHEREVLREHFPEFFADYSSSSIVSRRVEEGDELADLDLAEIH